MIDLEPRIRAFYRRVLRALTRARIPFVVCGTYAMQHHAGIVRATRDLDLCVRPSDVDRTLECLRREGLPTKIAFSHWLAKVYDSDGSLFVDVIWNSGNGISRVDDHFFENATAGTLFDVPVKFCPVEEMLWSKAFVMERERYDGADVAHLLHTKCDTIDWERLLTRFERHPQVLLSHLYLLEFIYPEDAGRVPRAIFRTLLKRCMAKEEAAALVCRGTLLSRQQYLLDLADGYADARVSEGNMSEEEVAAWTASITPNVES